MAEAVIKVILSKLPNMEIKLNEPLKNHTTFKIGGPVEAMIFPESAAQVTAVYDLLSEYDKKPLIIGNGSNILACDDKLDLLVINTSKMKNIAITDFGSIIADAGVLLSTLANFACEKGLTGLEFAHGIPGTAGGAVVMNAGAYGGEMKDVVFETTAYSPKTGSITLTAADNEFSYRNSRFSNCDDILLSVVFKLEKSNKNEIKAKMDDLYVRRSESQPLELASSGSTFKRPKEGYSAALIEQAGLKGYMTGGAQVSDKHSGFIVNTGNATFSDVMAVIDHVQDTVFKQTGILLEPEVKIIRE